jgi:cation diffusion facilitator CzcD-associated flavoprotein CzcO
MLPNAHIVLGTIDRIEPDGIVMTDGARVALDVLVYATGFDPHAYMRPMNVTGLNGVTIDEAWQEKIYSYGGIALPGFPNLFMLYGPFSPVNNVPVPLGLEQEIGCIMRLIAEARSRGAAVAPTVAATEKFLARPRRRLSRHRLGRRLQELVYQRATDAGAVAIPAERAQGVLRKRAGGGF